MFKTPRGTAEKSGKPEWLPMEQVLKNVYKANHIVKKIHPWHQHLLASAKKTRRCYSYICCTLFHCVKHWEIMCCIASSKSLSPASLDSWTKGTLTVRETLCWQRHILRDVLTTLYTKVIVLDFLHIKPNTWKDDSLQRLFCFLLLTGPQDFFKRRSQMSIIVCTQSLLLSKRSHRILKKRDYHWYIL